MAKIQITTTGIRKALKSFSYLQAIAEYVWNGFDAEATKIEIDFESNDLQGIDEIRVSDNGVGICFEELDQKFKPFLASEKQLNLSEKRITSTLHGKNGIGRLTFFHFARVAKWNTIYENNNKHLQYAITITADQLDDYKESPSFVETKESTGTTVTFRGIREEKINIVEVRDFLESEFCWYIELNKEKNLEIYINKEKLQYKNLIADSETFEVTTKENNYDVKYIRWSEKIGNEYSRFYFLDSKNIEKYNATTTFNKKGDKFYHSLFIKSNFFDDFDINLMGNDDELFANLSRNLEFKCLIQELNKYLRTKRKPYLRNCADELLKEYENQKILPKYNPKNIWEVGRKSELENLVKELYTVEPRIFMKLNIEQKKTFVRFLDLVMESGENERLFEIINEIINLDSNEREDLAKILKVSKLSGIVKTIKLIQDRYKVINGIKELAFNKEIHANERDHLQKYIENHYWIFGEQYHLVTAAEPKFEEALRRYVYLLTGEKTEQHIDHPDKLKEMDIFMVRQDTQNNIIRNVVVELKHPDITIGRKQYEQIDRYFEVVFQQDQFNANNMYWEFYLVGNDYNDYIERAMENAQNHGEQSLVFKNNRYKIYVKKWSEIITDFEIRHKYLNEKLELERARLVPMGKTANEIVENSKSNTAVRPEQIAINQ